MLIIQSGESVGDDHIVYNFCNVIGCLFSSHKLLTVVMAISINVKEESAELDYKGTVDKLWRKHPCSWVDIVNFST